eukprot:1142473-Pelagomonas_calceolata.AAC.10
MHHSADASKQGGEALDPTPWAPSKQEQQVGETLATPLLSRNPSAILRSLFASLKEQLVVEALFSLLRRGSCLTDMTSFERCGLFFPRLGQQAAERQKQASIVGGRQQQKSRPVCKVTGPQMPSPRVSSYEWPMFSQVASASLSCPAG